MSEWKCSACAWWGEPGEICTTSAMCQMHHRNMDVDHGYCEDFKIALRSCTLEDAIRNGMVPSRIKV